MKYKISAVIVCIILYAAVQVYAETPPVQPKVQETPLPPAIELPAPDSLPADIVNRPLTAAEAVKIAIEHNPSIVVARSAVNSALGKQKQAQAGEMPTLTTSATYNNRTINTSGGSNSSGSSSTGYQVSTTLKQLVYDFNHTRDLVRQSAAQAESTNSNQIKIQNDLALQVKQAFYGCLQNMRLVVVNESNVKNRQDHLALAKARVDAGVGLPSDVVRAETAVADAIYSLTAARNSSSISKVNLAQLMGIDPRTPIYISDSTETPVADDNLGSLIDLATKQRPEMIQAKLNVQAAEYGISSAKSSDSPSIGVNVVWQQKGNFPPENNTLTYGVAIQWTPFDAGVTKGKVQDAQAGLDSAKAQAEIVRLAVISDVSQDYLNMKTAQQKAAAADSQVANAEESVKLMVGRYESGLGTFLDVSDAQTSLQTAQTNRINAQTDVEQAKATLIRAIGSKGA